MPIIPALGIASRSDPKVRYTRRSVTEVATKNLNSVFPWKSYSKQGSPSPDKDGVTGNGEEEEKRKMFPSQDDKTNAFMDSLAQRINYMTSKIVTMSSAVCNAQVNGSQDQEHRSTSDEVPPTGKSTQRAEDNSEDSGLSTRDGSQVVSELATPDDGLDQSLNQSPSKCASPRSPKSSGSGSKVSSPSKHDLLDAEADACIIEASHRGFSILHALQERHRRSMYLEEAAVPAQTADEIVPKPEVMSQV